MKKHAVVLGLLVLSYLAYAMFWIAGLVVAAVAVGVAFRRSWRAAAVLLLTPLPILIALSFGAGVFGYLNGTARMRTRGMPGYEFWNLDPELRCHWQTSGCVVDGSEWITQGPNNAAIRLMAAVFGPMRGTYAGPYPTRLEAFRATRAEGSDIPAPSGVLEDAKDGPRRAVDWKGSTIIVGTRLQRALVAKESGEVYGRYHAQSLGPSLEELDLALEIDPMDGRAYHRRAWAFEEKGDAERAAADYREALKLLGKDDYLRGVIEERLRALSQ